MLKRKLLALLARHALQLDRVILRAVDRHQAAGVLKVGAQRARLCERLRHRSSKPVRQEDPPLARSQRLALPPLEVVVIVEPHVELLASVLLDELAEAVIDGLLVLPVVGREVARGRLVVLVHVLAIRRLDLRVEVVLKEDVARVARRNPRPDVRLDDLVKGLLAPRHRHRPIAPRLRLEVVIDVLAARRLLDRRNPGPRAAPNDGLPWQRLVGSALLIRRAIGMQSCAVHWRLCNADPC